MRFACAYYSWTNSKVLPTPLHKHACTSHTGTPYVVRVFPKERVWYTGHVTCSDIRPDIVVSNECLVATVSTLSCFNNLKEMKPSFSSTQQGANIDK